MVETAESAALPLFLRHVWVKRRHDSVYSNTIHGGIIQNEESYLLSDSIFSHYLTNTCSDVLSGVLADYFANCEESGLATALTVDVMANDGYHAVTVRGCPKVE